MFVLEVLLVVVGEFPGVNYPLMRWEKKVRGKLTRTETITTDLGTLSFRINQTSIALESPGFSTKPQVDYGD